MIGETELSGAIVDGKRLESDLLTCLTDGGDFIPSAAPIRWIDTCRSVESEFVDHDSQLGGKSHERKSAIVDQHQDSFSGRLWMTHISGGDSTLERVPMVWNVLRCGTSLKEVARTSLANLHVFVEPTKSSSMGVSTFLWSFWRSSHPL